MRQIIGTVILFNGGLALMANGHLFGLILVALGISAISFVIRPSPFGVLGLAAALLVSNIVLLVLLAVGIDGFFDGC